MYDRSRQRQSSISPGMNGLNTKKVNLLTSGAYEKKMFKVYLFNKVFCFFHSICERVIVVMCPFFN